MRCIDEIPINELKGRRVVVRADFNVPFDVHGNVSDVFRLRRGWGTVDYLSKHGARVILLSHIGREPGETLAPVAHALQRFGSVVAIPDLTGHAAQGAISAMKDGEIVLLENVRSDARETKNDESLAKELAAYGDIFVNDAFAAAHRAHASTVGIAKFLPSYAGLLMRDEVTHLGSALHPQSPSCAMLGGAKFETKAPLISNLLATYDHLFITGALANDVFKAQGFRTGRSRVSDELPGPEVVNHPCLVHTVDVVAERPDGHAQVKRPEEIDENDKIVDMGPDTFAALTPLIEKSQFILWNGPTGLYEDGYVSWTHAIAELLAKRAAEGASVVIGGGDTIAAIQDAGIGMDKLGFLSTGGGAMLEYLLKGTLPALEALDT